MRHVSFVAAVLACALLAGEVAARPGGGRGTPAGGRGGPATGGHRPQTNPGRQGTAGSTPGVRTNAPGNKINAGQLKGGKFDGRPNEDQLQKFLGERPNERTGERQPGQGREQFQAQASEIQSNLQGRADALFTPQWYLNHPNAWQAAHPHADAWAVATVGAVATWVGVNAVTAGGSATAGESGTSDEPPDDASETPTEEPAAAGELTSTGDASGQWLPLGVFALVRGTETDANTMLQLSVSKQGAIAGAYYDLIADAGNPVQGALDTKTNRAAWTVGASKAAVFATSLEALTSDNGQLTVHLPNGKTQEWNLVRMKK